MGEFLRSRWFSGRNIHKHSPHLLPRENSQQLIRHWHFAEAVEYVRETFNKFISQNKAASAALGQAEGEG